MNPTAYEAPPEFPGKTLRIDQPVAAGEPPELINAPDLTEDLANEVTSELAHSNRRMRPPLPQAIDAEVVVNHVAAGNAMIVTSGTVLRDRYVLEQPLGNGGTAIIFRALDMRRDGMTDAGQHVAIKVLRPELRGRPQSIARLKREFRQTQALAHPNVVRFHDLDCDRGTWFIAMELLTGATVGQWLRCVSPQAMPTTEALRMAAACGDALVFAHDRGVTHGDLKPGNVFVTDKGEVRVLDFGAAPESIAGSPAASRSTADQVVPAATRAYASPEVLAGRIPDPRDDVFSLACVVYEMLAGRHPYGRRGADEARDLGSAIEPLPGLSAQQWQALAASLAWRRELRPDVRGLMRALSNDAPVPALVREAEAFPVPIVQGELMRRSAGKWRGVAVIGLAIFTGVLIGRFAFESQSAVQSRPRVTPVAVASTAGDASASRDAASAEVAAGADLNATVAQVVETPEVSPPTGPPMPPGLVAFDAASMAVSRRAVVAAIPLRHFTLAERNVYVAWRVLDGTAVAGRDYGGPPSGVERFVEGHTFRMIYVPILFDAQAAGDRLFTVELTGASDGASLGTMRRIVVTILDDA